jgi:hypothetical protein
VEYASGVAGAELVGTVGGLESEQWGTLTEKLSKGFARRFRPTYAGANMGHPYGVVGPAAGAAGTPTTATRR